MIYAGNTPWSTTAMNALQALNQYQDTHRWHSSCVLSAASCQLVIRAFLPSVSHSELLRRYKQDYSRARRNIRCLDHSLKQNLRGTESHEEADSIYKMSLILLSPAARR
jgi:hypothetical protein